MSEIFRLPCPDEIHYATLGRLAELVHQAEDTGDDILLLQATDEVTRRDQMARRKRC